VSVPAALLREWNRRLAASGLIDVEAEDITRPLCYDDREAPGRNPDREYYTAAERALEVVRWRTRAARLTWAAHAHEGREYWGERHERHLRGVSVRVRKGEFG